MEKTTPVFVKIDEYKDVLDIVDLVKNKLLEAKHLIEQINEIKNQEDAELETWHAEILDVEKKIDYMDKTLFEPENL
ncbi:hypothetical protein HOK51_05970 [Candidatus Woesearchaeota archaeon]|jgi:hypothetical protein|nr:hypothetical protein [Candidatus Woesearchaeota archaeon]MBT6519374.1 hypothetical protein [Candidatus Woesearchaeota archaeon]MBT7368598.1 hypothetical protein [Candidatus Woesearchaeota archaeon]